MASSILVGLIFFAQIFNLFGSSMKNVGDFVDSVSCTGRGMEITLKSRLPPPRDGMWDLMLENYPKCPGATKKDVGGGYEFTILYADKEWCGVEPKSWFTPARFSYAEAMLILIDQNGTKIADSVSCIYNTRFENSLLSFRGEVTSENLRYGGSIEEDGTDVETVVKSGDSVQMDFYGPDGEILEHRHVKLGDPLVFRISIKETDHVTSVLPETCYFSSSSSPDEEPPAGQTLIFVRKSCFNEKNGMVRNFLRKMERSQNGTVYELPFPAFHFSEFGQNLFVHCTLLACVGNQKLCEPPEDECFNTNRRKRAILENEKNSKMEIEKEKLKELILTKYIIVESQKNAENFLQYPSGKSMENAVCMQTSHFAALLGSLAAMALSLLIITSCLIGRLAQRKGGDKAAARNNANFYDDKMLVYGNAAMGGRPGNYYHPMPYGILGSVQNLSTITSF